MELPPGVPVQLLWFAGWLFVSTALGGFVARLRDASAQHRRELEEASVPALDALNEYVQRLVRPASLPDHDPLLPRPVTDRRSVGALYRLAVNAWRPLHRYEMTQRAARLGTVFSVLHGVAAFSGGLAWWLADQHDAVTKADLAIFSFLLLPVVGALAVQLWGHFFAGTQMRT